MGTNIQNKNIMRTIATKGELRQAIQAGVREVYVADGKLFCACMLAAKHDSKWAIMKNYLKELASPVVYMVIGPLHAFDGLRIAHMATDVLEILQDCNVMLTVNEGQTITISPA